MPLRDRADVAAGCRSSPRSVRMFVSQPLAALPSQSAEPALQRLDHAAAGRAGRRRVRRARRRGRRRRSCSGWSSSVDLAAVRRVAVAVGEAGVAARDRCRRPPAQPGVPLRRRADVAAAAAVGRRWCCVPISQPFADVAVAVGEAGGCSSRSCSAPPAQAARGVRRVAQALPQPPQFVGFVVRSISQPSAGVAVAVGVAGVAARRPRRRRPRRRRVPLARGAGVAADAAVVHVAVECSISQPSPAVPVAVGEARVAGRDGAARRRCTRRVAVREDAGVAAGAAVGDGRSSRFVSQPFAAVAVAVGEAGVAGRDRAGAAGAGRRRVGERAGVAAGAAVVHVGAACRSRSRSPALPSQSAKPASQLADRAGAAGARRRAVGSEQTCAADAAVGHVGAAWSISQPFAGLPSQSA